MEQLQWYDWISLPTLLGAGGWALGSAMAIHGLHLALKRTLRSVIYAVLCFIVFAGTLTLGAMQHRDARVADSKNDQIVGGIDELKTLVKSNPSDSTEQVLAKAIEELRKISGPRRISKENKITMTEIIRSMGGHYISISALFGNEPFNLAKDLREMFVNADWESPGINTVVTAGAAPVGVAFGWKKSGDAPPLAQKLANLFNNFGIAVDSAGRLDASLPDDDSISILVGEKSN